MYMLMVCSAIESFILMFFVRYEHLYLESVKIQVKPVTVICDVSYTRIMIGLATALNASDFA